MNRYQSYKPSGIDWIGEIPKEWVTKRLTYSFKIQKGKIPNELIDEQQLNGLPYLSMDVLRGNEPTEFSIDKNIVEVNVGDIGILWDGSNSGEIIKINRSGILSSTVSLLSIIDKGLNKEFGFYLLKVFENDFKSNTTGMGIPHVNGNYVRETKLIIPNISEQTPIVQFLDEKTELIDKLILTKERKINLLTEQRTSLINQVVTSGLNPNVKMKDSGVEWIREIPEHWENSKIKHQFFFKGGGTPSTQNDLFWNGDIFWVSPKDMKSKFIVDTQDKITQLGLENSSSNLIKPNSLLMVVRSGILQRTIPVSINISEVSLNQDIKSIQSKGNVIIEFLYYFIKGNESNLLLEWSKIGCTVESIEMEYVNNFPFSFPNINEQIQIVEYLDSKTKEIDDLVQLEQRKIDLLKEYRQSLISEVVTGKVKVTQ